eukprot:2456768-Ditylum_brightwellii.AAC.1
MNMVCNWLTSNYLPKKNWYFALRAAAQDSNYMPIQTEEGTWTTPFEMVFQQKPDWCNLVPMFSLSYRATADSQSIKAICVGNDKKSDGLLFYIPLSKRLISSSDYTLDPTIPSGPVFNLYYDGCIGFNLYSPSSEQLHPLVYESGESIYYKTPEMELYEHSIILISPTEHNNIATIKNKTTQDILQVDITAITTLNPASVAEAEEEFTTTH